MAFTQNKARFIPIHHVSYATVCYAPAHFYITISLRTLLKDYNKKPEMCYNTKKLPVEEVNSLALLPPSMNFIVACARMRRQCLINLKYVDVSLSIIHTGQAEKISDRSGKPFLDLCNASQMLC